MKLYIILLTSVCCYLDVVKTLERLRLGSLKVQDILLMLKNPENIHNSLPIIQGIIKVFDNRILVCIEQLVLNYRTAGTLHLP